VAASISFFDHVGLIVDDLETVAAFFTGLGFIRDDVGESRGTWVDRIVGLRGTVQEIVLISAPDGSGHIELTKFHSPQKEGMPRELPSNAYGLRHIAYRVTNVNASVVRGFHIYRESEFQVRVEAFNLLNHPQLTTNPNATIGGGTFGYITTFGNTRSLQFSGRFNF